MQWTDWQPLDKLLNLPRSFKRFIMVSCDSILIPAALYLSVLLITGNLFSIPSFELIVSVLFATALTVPIFALLGLYHAIVRFMGDKAIIAVLQGGILSALILGIADYFYGHHLNPQTLIIFSCLMVLMIGGSRLFMRRVIHTHSIKKRQKVIIYGAGETGTELLRALKSNASYQPIAFLDDRRQIQCSVIDGIRVESPKALPNIIKKHHIKQVLLAMPSVSRGRKRSIINLLEPYPVQIKTIPSLTDIMSGKAAISDIQEIDIEDLLGRDPVEPDPALMSACIKDKTVLITGAGGSIGSELCRQIIAQHPKQLLILDSCEYALYSIERELNNLRSQDAVNLSGNREATPILSFLANVQDRSRLDSIFSTFDIDTVYHAAAFKHVPMVENNIIDGIKNNVFGTLNCAQAALEHHISTFVLVSTDKAVRPTNVMGTTKRLAELTLQALADTKPKTVFCMVRFGNVLGSSGSVVPLFREQIAKGGPMTVTHPEVIRYFMTIPEAAQLVIQAGAMAKGGDVFVLDMGEPVKIADLARKMVRLMGLEIKNTSNPRGDIEIQFTGLRPGEKLFEELLIGENPSGTPHQRIMKADESYLNWENMNRLLDGLQQACEKQRFEKIIELMLTEVTGFAPREKPNDHVYRQGQQQQLKQDRLSNVTALKSI